MLRPIVMKLFSSSTKYETLLLVLVVIALATVLAIWLWLGVRTHQLEQEIYKMK